MLLASNDCFLYFASFESKMPAFFESFVCVCRMLAHILNTLEFLLPKFFTVRAYYSSEFLSEICLILPLLRLVHCMHVMALVFPFF